jgi:hypothetical protein
MNKDRLKQIKKWMLNYIKVVEKFDSFERNKFGDSVQTGEDYKIIVELNQ